MHRQPHSDRSWPWNLSQLSSNQDRVAYRRRRHAHVPGHLERPMLDGQPLGRQPAAGGRAGQPALEVRAERGRRQADGRMDPSGPGR